MAEALMRFFISLPIKAWLVFWLKVSSYLEGEFRKMSIFSIY